MPFAPWSPRGTIRHIQQLGQLVFKVMELEPHMQMNSNMWKFQGKDLAMRLPSYHGEGWGTTWAPAQLLAATSGVSGVLHHRGSQP